MNAFIDIIEIKPVRDADGIAVTEDIIVASVRAYREDRHGGVRWANMAPFADASALFRFRMIPGLEVTTAHVIVCAAGRYRLLSVEDVRGRGMYIEVLASKIEPTVR